MPAKPISGARRVALRLSWVVISLALLLPLGGWAGLSPESSSSAWQKRKYMIMLTVSKDSTLEKTMDREFLTAIKQDRSTLSLSVARSGKPWEDTETCKNEPRCDRMTINAEKRMLLISCNENTLDKKPGPPCSAATEPLFREKCIDSLPKDLVKHLANHSKAFHAGEDQ